MLKIAYCIQFINVNAISLNKNIGVAYFAKQRFAPLQVSTFLNFRHVCG